MGRNLNEIIIEIHIFSTKKMHSKMAGNLSRHQCVEQAMGLDAWASRVKCPAQFISHIYMCVCIQ